MLRIRPEQLQALAEAEASGHDTPAVALLRARFAATQSEPELRAFSAAARARAGQYALTAQRDVLEYVALAWQQGLDDAALHAAMTEARITSPPLRLRRAIDLLEHRRRVAAANAAAREEWERG